MQMRYNILDLNHTRNKSKSLILCVLVSWSAIALW